MPNGNDIINIEMLKVSLSSDMISLFIGISTEEQLVPAGNVTRYCVLFPFCVSFAIFSFSPYCVSFAICVLFSFSP